MTTVPQSDLPGTTRKAVPAVDLPSGAALVSPKQKITPSSPETKERVRSLSETAGEYLFGEPERQEFSGEEVGGAATMGTAAALGLPYALQKGGRFVGKLPLPYAKPVGTAAEALGIGMGRMPVTKRAVMGGGGGAAASSAEQAAELAGLPKVASVPIGFVTGGVAPELGEAIKTLAKKAGSTIFGSQGMTTAIMRDLQSQGVEITPKIAQLIEKEVSAFRQAPKGKGPQEALYQALRTGATDITQEAERMAGQRVGQGLQAQTAAEAQAAKMAAANKKTTEIADKTAQEARAARAQVGQEREASEIGSSLRDKIMSVFGGQTEARSAQYQAQKQIRDDIVRQLESQGKLVKDLPEYKTLIDSLRSKLLIGAKAQEQTTAPVTEKGVLQAYQNIYDAVTARRIQVGTNELGNPVYKTFPTSFDALDDVRRRLGDVAFGKEVEGYSAIGADIAKKYYAQISELQSKFAGEAHDVLQGGYEAASRLLDKYRSAAGKKATALDRFDPTRFKTDAASLPAEYFTSKQSVKDLVELTGGDTALVQKAANDYAARQLKDLSTKQVQNWINKNNDWLTSPELSGLKQKVDQYLKTLERSERVFEKSKAAATKLGTMETQKLREADRAMKEAQDAGVKITKEAADRVRTILGSKFPNEEIEKLMLSGSIDRWAEVAPILAKSAIGRDNIESAVRQVMSRVSPRSMGDTFRDAVRQRLETTGLVSPAKLDEIQRQLDYISSLTLTSDQKMSLLQRITKNILTTVPATILGAPAGAVLGEE